jgi:hypothetical protein
MGFGWSPGRRAHQSYRTLELDCPTWWPESLQPSNAEGKMDCTLDLVPHEDLTEECGPHYVER